MDTAKIKSYAPKARKNFIEAIARQAALLGITAKGITPIEIKGDIALIDGKPHPAAIAQQRRGLERLIEQQGYQQVIEKIAYSWFNRLVALRYMELHNYLDHGRRVLSHPEQDNAYQILEECADIEMEGLDKQQVIQLKLAGDQDEELYRLLLLAQCHQLHQAMGFLFEAVDDASELLLPNNLTKTDSLIRQLVSAIPEEQWQNVEIIGWLYQFYISEKKDQVIGKVVKSEDIPAATQLFTPNWIVKYLVQNSIGRQWLMTYPDSPLKGQMKYYIEPAEQTDEVQDQLKAITPESIDPQSLKVLDPACGSGHILVEAYDLLKAIYAERGYRSRDIPQLILENNLYGLDIDDRAAQLAGFALLMKARADDRCIFSRNTNFNVLALQSSQHLNSLKLWNDLNLHGQWQKEQTDELFGSAQGELSEPQNDADYQLIVDLIERFQQAKTFGSLIDVPHSEQVAIETFYGKLRELSGEGDTRQKPAALALLPILKQALVLSQRYDAVVANPPYMGSKYYNATLKTFVNKNYKSSKGDLYVAFIEKNLKLAGQNQYVGMITIPNWMFLSSFESIREYILDKFFIDSFVHNGRGVWGSDFGSCSFIFRKTAIGKVAGCYKRLFNKQGSIASNEELVRRFFEFPDYYVRPDDFKIIPGFPIAYWVEREIREKFSTHNKLSQYVFSDGLLKTGNNDKHVRFFWEIPQIAIEKNDYRFMAKGGEARDFYGNDELVVMWDEESRNHYRSDNVARITPEYLWTKEAISWSKLTVGRNTFRYIPGEHISETVGPCVYAKDDVNLINVLVYLRTSTAEKFLKLKNPTVSLQTGDVISIPYIDIELGEIPQNLMSAHIEDWNKSEATFGFKNYKLLSQDEATIKRATEKYIDECHEFVRYVQDLEKKANEIFSSAFELEHIISNEVALKDVSLRANPEYLYVQSDALTINERFKSDIVAGLMSYAVGCMMGRYSLDREGLVYAHSGNEGFAELMEEGAYNTFPTDDDGIIPLSDQEWFDDATNRFRDFVKIVWGEEQLQENLAFVAESLCLHAIKAKRGEASLETIRRYLATQFYKDHLKTYKKRPIYWLFSSGKQKAFECLVYLHRYNAGTLARMRTEYVIPLTSKLNSHVEKLEQDKESSESAAEVKKIEKELQTLHKKQAELSSFDEKLRHYADQRIELDLDDGVKVNYGKFGDLLADVKAVTGKKT